MLSLEPTRRAPDSRRSSRRSGRSPVCPHSKLPAESLRLFARLLMTPGVASGTWGEPLSLGSERRGVYLDLVCVLPIPDLSSWRTTRIRLSQGGRLMTRDGAGVY